VNVEGAWFLAGTDNQQNPILLPVNGQPPNQQQIPNQAQLVNQAHLQTPEPVLPVVHPHGPELVPIPPNLRQMMPSKDLRRDLKAVMDGFPDLTPNIKHTRLGRISSQSLCAMVYQKVAKHD
jgi:hypothetical protein